MKSLTLDLDLDEEVRALAAFISAKWTPITGIEAMFRDIRDAALRDARAWFDNHGLWERATELRDERKEVLGAACRTPAEKATAPYYDAVYGFLMHASLDTDRLMRAGHDVDGTWDYERRVRPLTAKMLDEYPELAKSRPHGWDELAKNYEDFDGMEEYRGKEDRAQFQGAEVPGTCSAPFPGRVALPYVMYNEKCQNLKAANTLVGSVYAQFLGIAEFLNTRAAQAALSAFVAQQPAQMVFCLTGSSDNPFIRVLLEVSDPPHDQQSYLKALAARERFDALTPEEKEAQSRDRELDTDSMLSEVLDPNSDFNRKQRAKEEKIQQLVREYFSA